MKFGKDFVQGNYPEAWCRSFVPYRFRNSPKHIQRKETHYIVQLSPANTVQTFVGYSASEGWKHAEKFIHAVFVEAI